MLYVQQALAPDEDLVYIAKFHWFYDVQSIMCIVWGLFFAVSILVSFQILVLNIPHQYADYILTSPLMADDGWLSIIRKMHPGIKLLALFVFLVGLMKFAHMFIIKITTEIAVTTNRIIFKRGLVARNIGEISIDRIESISVTQTIMGRLFDFGRLIIHGMGVGEMVMPNLAEPIVFRKAIEKAKMG